ncbi:uncharacterized protein LODBEIA_P42650 [Lodderomyces beijingensis]|uniref:Uncharacterized protein n=1 Tax=Lodderomyces beijingensis TaxID=1775926 RepID=A0ABP0ZSE7_9ASCO
MMSISSKIFATGEEVGGGRRRRKRVLPSKLKMPLAEAVLKELAINSPTGQRLQQQKKIKTKYSIFYTPYKWLFNYYYSSPMILYSAGETVLYNLITLGLFSVLAFYVVWVLPAALIQSLEKFYFYLTGSHYQ